ETLFGAVGEETAHILKIAHEAAADIKAKAQENASRILKEAHQQAETLRGEAETVLARRTEEAEVQAARIREAAKSEAERLLDQTRQQAKAIRAQSEAERNAMIEGAQATREKILSALSKKRNVAVAQVEALRAGRERLLEAYQVVRLSLDQATVELARAETEARAAADAVRHRPLSLDEPDGLDEFDPPTNPTLPIIQKRLRPATSSAPPRAAAPAAAPSAAAAPLAAAAVPASPAAPPVTAPPAAPPVDAPAAAAPPPAAPSAAAAAASAFTPPVVGSRPTDAAASSAAATTPSDSLAKKGPASGPVPRRPAGGTAGPVSAPQRDDAPPAPRAEPPEPVPPLSVVGAPEPETPPEQQQPPLPPEVVTEAVDRTPSTDDLFQRIRKEVVPDADEALLQRRDVAMEPIEAGLTRRLKRALQDDQNDLLDRLRHVRASQRPAAVLPGREAHAARFREVARPFLAEAVDAGVAFTASLTPSVRSFDHRAGVDAAAEELAQAIVEPLRRRLDSVLTDGEGDDAVILAEAVGAAYREWKTKRVEVVGADHVVAAFSRGAYAATPAAATLRWLVEDVGGPCPDCDDNVLAGGQPKGEAFPTGQRHPPAHPGCRCLLVPHLG
ncbi:MAG TPA: ATP synthase F0 subunit B, partial [Acidimicrobiales bacterium]|nr:ATP synthase F0 subunit B [Acidimicrobiales bacterium]